MEMSWAQVLKEQEGSISIKELSAATMIKTEDIISTLQHLNLIQYQKGQHVICAAPAVIERHLKQAGSPGLQVPSLHSGPCLQCSHADWLCMPLPSLFAVRGDGASPGLLSLHPCQMRSVKAQLPKQCFSRSLLTTCLRMQVDPKFIVWCPYSAEREYALYRN